MSASTLKPFTGLIHRMTLAERIKEAMGNTGNAEFARAVEVTNAAVTSWLNGATKTLKAETAQKIERATGFRAGWLVDGTLPKLIQFSNVKLGPDIRGHVPVISFVKAGTWDGVIDNLTPGEAEDWLPCVRPHSSGTYALRVEGESMTAPHGGMRTYPHGCIIFVDPEKRMPSNGDRVIARLQGSDSVTFKTYKNEDGQQWLQPLNPNNPSIRDNFTVIGTVIGKWEDE